MNQPDHFTLADHWHFWWAMLAMRCGNWDCLPGLGWERCDNALVEDRGSKDRTRESFWVREVGGDIVLTLQVTGGTMDTLDFLKSKAERRWEQAA